MGYKTDSIHNIKTIKASRGEELIIDLGQENSGTLKAWMKRDVNSLSYRSFDISDDGRYISLTKEKASDYLDLGDTVIEAVAGRWHFDVEQTIDDEEKKTIYRGTILFQNDVTGGLGYEIEDPITKQ